MRLRVPTLGAQPPVHCYFFNILTSSLTGLLRLYSPPPSPRPLPKRNTLWEDTLASCPYFPEPSAV